MSATPTARLSSAIGALTHREVRKAVRTPAVTVQSVIFPVMLLLVLLAVFGAAVGEVDAAPYVQRLAPALVISGAAFGSLGAVTGFLQDRDGGVFGRLRLAPFPTRRQHGVLAYLIARSAGEHVRVFTTAMVVTAVSTVLGFRFQAGLVRAAMFFVVATLVGASFGWIGFALAARSSSMETVVPPANALFLVLLFFSEGMVPRQAFPGWAQPIVQVAPASVMTQALQRLAWGGELRGVLLGALGWALGITLVFGALTFRGLTSARPSN